MNYEMLNNNIVYLEGDVATKPVLDHNVYDEDFYSFKLKVARLSGQDDVLPVIISQKLLAINNLNVGDHIALKGQFRSHNKMIEGKSKLLLSIFCRELCELNAEPNTNSIKLTGYICKPPIYRTTPFDREICDVLLAVNRTYDKSDYIPSIAWGRNAKFVASLPVGTKITVAGRIQSRTYNKHVEDNAQPIVLTAYEVSISNICEENNERAL